MWIQIWTIPRKQKLVKNTKTGKYFLLTWQNGEYKVSNTPKIALV